MFKSVVTKIIAVAALSSLSLACYGDTYVSGGFGFHEYEETLPTTASQTLDSSLTSAHVRAGKQSQYSFGSIIKSKYTAYGSS